MACPGRGRGAERGRDSAAGEGAGKGSCLHRAHRARAQPHLPPPPPPASPLLPPAAPVLSAPSFVPPFSIASLFSFIAPASSHRCCPLGSLRGAPGPRSPGVAPAGRVWSRCRDEDLRGEKRVNTRSQRPAERKTPAPQRKSLLGFLSQEPLCRRCDRRGAGTGHRAPGAGQAGEVLPPPARAGHSSTQGSQHRAGSELQPVVLKASTLRLIHRRFYSPVLSLRPGHRSFFQR